MDLASRLVRWRLKLEEYDYEVVHKADKGNTNVGSLSRNSIPDDQHVNNVTQGNEEEEKKEEDIKRIYGRRKTSNTIRVP